MLKKALDYIYVVSGNGLSRALALVNSVIIARLLGPAAFGAFSIFFSVMMLIKQLPYAFDITYVRFAKVNDSANEKNEFLKATVLLKSGYALALLLICYPASIFVASNLFNKPELSGLLTIAVVAGLPPIFLLTISAVYQERERFLAFAILNSIYTFFVFATLLFICYRKKETGLGNIASLYLGVSIIIGIPSFFYLLKRIKNIFLIHTATFKTAFSFGKWILGVSCVYYIFNELAMLLLPVFLEFEAIGIYSAGSRLAMSVFVISGALAGVFLPRASTALTSKSAFREYLKESAAATAAISLFIVLLFALSPALIKLLYGAEFLPSASVMRILLAGIFFAVIYTPLSYLFYTLGDSRTRFLLESLKLLIVIALLFVLAPKSGITGVAVAISIGLVFNTALSTVILAAKIKTYFNRKKEQQ